MSWCEPLGAADPPITESSYQDDSKKCSEVLRDVLAGLSQPQKALPGKYLWDETGSILFDRICSTKDYYLTRREITLLRDKADEVARLVGPGATIIEFGSGASHKVRVLLDTLQAPRRYVAIDISREFLHSATERIARDYPDIEVTPSARITQSRCSCRLTPVRSSGLSRIHDRQLRPSRRGRIPEARSCGCRAELVSRRCGPKSR